MERIDLIKCCSGVGSSINASREVSVFMSPAVSRAAWSHFERMSKMVVTEAR